MLIVVHLLMLAKNKNSKLVIIQGGDHGFHKDECMVEALKESLKFINE